MARPSTRVTAVLVAAGLVALGAAAPALAHGGKPTTSTTRFYVPPPPDGSVSQIIDLVRARNFADAKALASMIRTPQSVWLESGTPKEVRSKVRWTMRQASVQRAVPTFVIYNLPYRDCGQYSAGGAAGTAAYQAWIDGIVRGLGQGKASIILEPDGLGLIPNYADLDGNSNCTMPTDPSLPADAAPTPENRFEQLTYAVDAFADLPNVSVYLDATHTGWQNVGESADRLIKADVEHAAGFFLNASNYHYTENLEFYGTWVSQCLAYVTEVNPGAYGECGNQYWNGGPANNWQGVAMNPFGIWSEDATDPALSTAGITSRYANALGDVEPTAHFVIDTSRNGQGPWQPTAGYSDAQDWCNPPGRGLGDRPEATPVADNPLLDAYLWIKTPGESDGQCSRGTGGTVDPEWGIVDPVAGSWFREQALELVHLADPPLR